MSEFMMSFALNSFPYVIGSLCQGLRSQWLNICFIQNIEIPLPRRKGDEPEMLFNPVKYLRVIYRCDLLRPVLASGIVKTVQSGKDNADRIL